MIRISTILIAGVLVGSGLGGAMAEEAVAAPVSAPVPVSAVPSCPV
jgi:hypothetical protein